MTEFVIGALCGVVVGTAVAIAHYETFALEQLRAENRAKTLALENGARIAQRAGMRILAAYLRHVLDDEAGA